MGMQIEKSFVVNAARTVVWDFLVDPYKVAKCLPGAAITEKISDREYAGTMTVKVGPVTASYRGRLRFERLDAAAGEADLAASGQETKGKGGADMRMKSRVLERAVGVTEVTVTSDVNVFGILAQFGRGMIQDVSDQMFQKFSTAMRSELETAAAAPAPSTPEALAGSAVGTGDAAVGAASAVASAATSRTTAGSVAGSAAAVASSAAASTPAVPVPVAQEAVLDVGAIGAAAAGRAAVRTLQRPGFWLALVALALLLYAWLR